MGYKYLNVNPLGAKENDCVIRAISLALNEDYILIAHKLMLIADIFDCDALCVCCYEHLLDSVYKLNRVYAKGMTVNEFIDTHPTGTYLIRLNGHLTCAKNGNIFDIWDCSNETIDKVWCVKGEDYYM